jgi:hypothetical protein
VITTEIVKTLLVDPDPNNPREDMGDLVALAATFTINTERPGEPINPPILVRDGKRYRIVDGERRYRAMLEGTAEPKASFTAIVADGLDEASSLLAMLATDDKKRLTDAEHAKGVQQMLVLGIEPSLVARAARIAEQQAYAVKGALTGKKKVKKPETLSLKRLAAEYEYPILEKQLIEAIEASGLERDDTATSGWPKFDTVEWCIETVAEFEKAVAKLPKKNRDGIVVAFIKGVLGNKWNVNLVTEPYIRISKRREVTKSGEPKKTDAEVLLNQFTKQNKAARKARRQWIGDHIATWDKDLKHFGAWCLDHLSYHISGSVSRLEEETGCVVPRTPNALIIASVCGEEYFDRNKCKYAITNVTVQDYMDGREEKTHIAMMEALIADGYPVSDEEQALMDVINAWLVKLAVCKKEVAK